MKITHSPFYLTNLTSLAAFCMLAACGISRGQLIITDSASAPTTNLIISQSDFSGTYIGSQDFSNDGGAPGQTFTAPVNFTLDAITVKGNGTEGSGANGDTFTITFGTVNNFGAVTVLDKESVTWNYSSGSDYGTFTLGTQLALASGAKYAYSIFETGNGGGAYYGFAGSGSNVYAGGSAFQEGNAYGSTANVGQTDAVNAGGLYSYDRTFFIQGTTTVPEPSITLYLGVGLLALFLGMRLSRKQSQVT